MSNFKDFADRGLGDNNSPELMTTRHAQTREASAGSPIERVWATDFERCRNREDFERYISKYEKYGSNMYVSQAKAKIELLDAAENARAESERISRQSNQQVRHTLQPPPPYNLDGKTDFPKTKGLHICVRELIWIIVIGGVGCYSYNMYKNENRKSEPAVLVDPSSAHPKVTQEGNHESVQSEPRYEPAAPIVERDPEPEEVWWDCTICGATGVCNLCYNGACATCGGTGQVFSVFYGDEVGEGRMTSCGNCGGSGRCPSCNGTNQCFACGGRGRCKLEFE